jgi:hypothetical protein
VRKVRRLYDKEAAGRLQQIHFMDGSFVPAKKGDVRSAKRNGVKAPRSWQSQTLALLFYLSQSNL